MSNINELINIMAKLRDPQDGCPWDVEQDFNSIAKHTLEEAYEVVDAIESDDVDSLREELGDLLLQVIFHSQMAREKQYFNFDDVVKGIVDKLIFRHPHVFGNKKKITAKQQEQEWEKHKEKEKTKSQDSALDGITKALPALAKSIKLQKKAAKQGFDWINIDEVFAKLDEEVKELQDSILNNSNIEDELGDVLFTVSNLCRKLNIDPETALRKTNNKFYSRFRYIESQAKSKNRKIQDLSLEEMEAYWQAAK